MKHELKRKRHRWTYSYKFRSYDEYEDNYAWIKRQWKPEARIYKGRKVA